MVGVARRGRRIIGIVLAGIVGGLAGAFVGFGPLTGDFAGLAAGAAVGAAVYGGLWWWALSAPGRRAACWLLAALPVIFLVALAGLALFQMIAIGAFDLPTADRLDNFDRLWRALRDYYPYFELKGVDWEDVYLRYRPLIEQAGDDDAYFNTIAAMLAELNDAHTMVSQPFLQPAAWFGEAEDIEGQVVITGLSAEARAAGLERGDVVAAVNSQPVEQALAALPPALRYGSTPANRRDFALSNLLALWAPAASLELTVRGADGQARQATLRPASQPAEGEPPRPPVWGERLPSGVGYIEIARFWQRSGEDLVALFDAALDGLMDTPGLVIDLRRNGGGNSALAARMAGRLLSEPFVYGREFYRQGLPFRLWRRWNDRRVDPRGATYTGPVALLTDATSISTAEEFIISLVDSGRARTVGRPSGGGTGNPVVFKLPGGAVTFSTGDLRQADGTPIEGRGVTPDVPVAWTLADVRAGRDPDLEAAQQLLSIP